MNTVIYAEGQQVKKVSVGDMVSVKGNPYLIAYDSGVLYAVNLKTGDITDYKMIINDRTKSVRATDLFKCKQKFIYDIINMEVWCE